MSPRVWRKDSVESGPGHFVESGVASKLLDTGTFSTDHSALPAGARRSLSKFLKDISSLRTGGTSAARAYASAKPKAATTSCESTLCGGIECRINSAERIPSRLTETGYSSARPNLCRVNSVPRKLNLSIQGRMASRTSERDKATHLMPKGRPII